MKNIYLTGIFSLLLLGSPSAEAEPFSDIQNHEFAESIEYAKTQNTVVGYADGTFKPNNTINRAEFTKIIVGALFEETDIKECIIDEENFSDVSEEDWFAPYICVALEENIVSGYQDNTFRPSNEIAFVEAAKIIDIAFDGSEISGSTPWYDPYVQNLGDFGVIPQSISQLDKKITRAEMTEILWRWEEEVSEKDFMGYENGNLFPLFADEVVFGVSAQTAEECESGEVFDAEYQLCLLKDDAIAQEKVTEIFGDFSQTTVKAPAIKTVQNSSTENTTSAQEGVIVQYSIQKNILKMVAEGKNLSDSGQKFLNNKALHKKIWNEFNTMIPNISAKERIVEFILFSGTGENEGTLAYVQQKEGAPEQWILAINATENFSEDGKHLNAKDFYYTLIHEFAHVLTLNEDNTSGFASECASYEIETGCLKETAAMGRLVENFWKESPHWQQFLANPQDENLVYERYENTPNRYVTDYAATNPGEDIAETITYFILNQKSNEEEIKN